MAELVRNGEVQRLAQHCEEFRGRTPLETGELLPSEAVSTTEAVLRCPPEPPPPVIEERPKW